ENLLPPSLIISVTIARDLLRFWIKCIRRLYFWVLRVADLCVVENMEKLMSKAELSKEMCTFPAMHPSNCGINEARINNDVNVGKGETSSAAVAVAIPIADS
ncbi:hypothetical protein Gotur_001923, partial [Gossypium turneri]